MNKVIPIHPREDFQARSHSVLNDPAQRKNFRGAMDYLQSKRKAQFADDMRKINERISKLQALTCEVTQ